MMTLQDRAACFAAAFAKWPASHLRMVREQDREVLYGIWVLGNDYRNRSALYGAYPPGYLARVMALFPDAGENVLHAFSGALPPGPYVRLDLIDRCGIVDPQFVRGDVCQAASLFGTPPHRFTVMLADPPYSVDDAKKYGTPMVNRRQAMAALAAVAAPGAHLVWLDTVWPMHSKRDWLTVGRILLQRSTNHRARVVSIFERAAA